MDHFKFPGSVPQQPHSTPGEPLFEFTIERDQARWLCELRDLGPPFGVEVQFFQNEVLRHRRQFKTRSAAVQWAEDERKAIEEGGA